MPEPNSITIGILAGTGIGLTGTVMGAQVDALLMGMIAAVFVSIWLPSINDRLRAASAVGISSLLAGYGSPECSAYHIISTPQGTFTVIGFTIQFSTWIPMRC
jgi:hypothetical protein